MTTPFGQVQQAAVAAHEVFTSYVNAGFTREEALRIVIALVTHAHYPEHEEKQ